jgi:hypothetical protein
VAWPAWLALNIALFGWSVAWAYRRRPLATALLVAALGVPLAAHLDTGNVGLLLVLGIWLAHFSGPRVGGFAWAVAAALKWLPAWLILFIPPRARVWGLALLGLMALLTLATFPGALRQLDVVLNFPRPLRLDYLMLAWAAVPWLWSQPWPPWWLTPGGLRDGWRSPAVVVRLGAPVLWPSAGDADRAGALSVPGWLRLVVARLRAELVVIGVAWLVILATVALLATHDPLLLDVADRVIEIRDGRMVDSADTRTPAALPG